MGTDSSSFCKLKLHQKVKMKVLLCSFALVAVAVASDLSLNSNIAKFNQHNDEHARGEHTWTMSVNQFADLTHDEFMAMQTLKVKDLPKTTQKYQMKAPAVASSVDWRDQGYVTSVKDQKQWGSCWAFGAVASMEAAHFEKYGTTVQMSEQQVVDCDTRNSGCNGGWYDTAWKYVNGEGGIETQADYPYTGRDGTCKAGNNDFVSNVDGCHGGPNFYCPGHGLVGDEAELEK